MRRRACLIAAAVACGVWGFEARAQHCVPNGFGYGNGGYAAGYSFRQIGGWNGVACAPQPVGWCAPRYAGWCGPRVGWGGWCAPRYTGWCGPRVGWGGWYRPWRGWCAPRWNWGGGWCGPRWGWGGCNPWLGWGTTWFSSCDSVYLSAPGGTFFSGAAVPFPAPIFAAPIGIPFAATAPQRPALEQPVVERAIVRASNAATRLRAARLVAVGDRHLREANGNPGRLRAALAAYRGAARIARDQPDTLVRQAIVLTALGDAAEADEVAAKAAAIDGRLAAVAEPPRPGLTPDPVFGERSQEGLPPLAARGTAILREIGAEAAAGEERPAVAWLAKTWASRWGGQERLARK
jgi:hypothetical protein